LCRRFASVVFTTDSGNVGVRPLTSCFEGLVHVMFRSKDDNKFDLECLRLASDLRQLARATLDPDLREHCLRMAKQLSGAVDEPIEENAAIDKDLAE
jgi:hypothetical protein